MNLAEKLYSCHDLSDDELAELISSNEYDKDLYYLADKVRRKYYNDEVYIRGLIEISNICKNDCYYCGIRKSNNKAVRYRLSESEISDCCDEGFRLGFRTFVLQGGEDGHYNDDTLCSIVDSIKTKHPDCAVTLSLGERSYESYKRLFEAGADRYLLRHETASDEHYHLLHPSEMSLNNRKECLFNLKQIGYQTGSGFMVGSPFQRVENLIADLRFLQELMPAMIGIGPFITHHDTPFFKYKSGDLYLTLRLVSVLRLMFPYALIPSTTALGTIHPKGREMGLCAGANVVMPNLSPVKSRKLYELYDNKICTGEESAQCRDCLEQRVSDAGYRIVTDRGDVRERICEI